MGFLIVLVVGAILGWLATLTLDLADRGSSCVWVGACAALVGTALAGGVSLLTGIAPVQLFGAIIGAVLALTAVAARGSRGRAQGRKI